MKETNVGDPMHVIDTRTTRRTLLRQLLGGTAAGIAFPGLSAASPVWRYLQDDELMNQADAQVVADSWQPAFLTLHQNDTLIVLAERIVPNSNKARVNRIIDLLLNVDSEVHQKQFTESLAAIDRESQQRSGAPFKTASEARQNELLTLFSTSPYDAASGAATTASDEDTRVELFGHFENLKRWISDVFFTTETGMRELGWTGDVFFAGATGCLHPEGHS